MNEQLNESQIIPIYVVYSFIKKLITPYDQTEAYRLGIIDANGKILRRRSELKTRQEKNAYTVFDTLVWNIKRLVDKLPGGKTKLATYAAALWLIKEAANAEIYEEYPELMEKEFVSFTENINLTEQQKQDMMTIGDLVEETVTDSPADIKQPIGLGAFVPKIKYTKEHTNQKFMESFYELSEDIANVTGAGVATDRPTPPNISPGTKKDIEMLRRVKPYLTKSQNLTSLKK